MQKFQKAQLQNIKFGFKMMISIDGYSLIYPSNPSLGKNRKIKFFYTNPESKVKK